MPPVELPSIRIILLIICIIYDEEIHIYDVKHKQICGPKMYFHTLVKGNSLYVMNLFIQSFVVYFKHKRHAEPSPKQRWDHARGGI